MRSLLSFLWMWIAGSVFFLQAQENALQTLVGTDCLTAGSASILVYDLDQKKDLYAFDENRALPTASIQKLWSTAAALSVRGSDFRYRTEIGHTGQIRGEVLDGDLVVTGSGDPSLGSEYFPELPDLAALVNEVVETLLGAGIRKVTGNIVLDNHKIRGQNVPGGWPWADLGNYYGAGHWAFNIHDNEYTLVFQQNPQTGGPVAVREISPEIPGFSVISEVTSGPPGSGDQAYIYAGPYSTQAVVRGTIPQGSGTFTIRGSIPDPPGFFGVELAAKLAERHIGLDGEVVTLREFSPEEPIRPLMTWESPRLQEIIRITNYHSVNMYAEAMMRLLCEETDAVSQFTCGRRELRKFWEGHGVDPDLFFLTDGSGLSPRNTASARAFVQALSAIYADETWYSDFYPTLPVMGRDGTLRFMLREYKGTGSIYAKSGYIGRQRSYTGFINTESGRHLVFCVILDNYGCGDLKMRKRIEDFLIPLLKK